MWIQILVTKLESVSFCHSSDNIYLEYLSDKNRKEEHLKGTEQIGVLCKYNRLNFRGEVHGF